MIQHIFFYFYTTKVICSVRWCYCIFGCIMGAAFWRTEYPLTYSLSLQGDNKENSTIGAMKKHNSDDLKYLRTGQPKITSSRKVLHPQNWWNWIICFLQHTPSLWCFKMCFQNFCVCVILGLADPNVSECYFNALIPNIWYTYHTVLKVLKDFLTWIETWMFLNLWVLNS